MNDFLLRAIVTAIIAIYLAVRLRSIGGLWRRRAYTFGIVAFGLIALSNAMALGAIAANAIAIVSFVSLALLAAALGCLVRSYQTGEMREQFQRARTMVDEERRRTSGNE